MSARLSCGSGRADADADIRADNVESIVCAHNSEPIVCAHNASNDSYAYTNPCAFDADNIGADGWVAGLYADCGVLLGVLSISFFSHECACELGERVQCKPPARAGCAPAMGSHC